MWRAARPPATCRDFFTEIAVSIASPSARDFSANSMLPRYGCAMASLNSRIQRGERDKNWPCGITPASAGEAAMSAAMVNVGLMRVDLVTRRHFFTLAMLRLLQPLRLC